MNNQVFGSVYADQYDLFYKDKDYEAEHDMIEKIFSRNAGWSGQHHCGSWLWHRQSCHPLARCGYQVTGVDRSSEMVGHAKAKVQSHTSRP